MTAAEGHRENGHLLLNLVAAPLLGLVYVIVMPFIAVGTVLAAAGTKAVVGLSHLAANLVSFGWRPSEAHLAGKKKGRKRSGNNQKE